LNERCEDGLNDLGAVDSEIVTSSDLFIYFSHDFFVNSNSEFLFRHSYEKLKIACITCTVVSIR